MEPQNHEPFDRELWQRLLRAASDGPAPEMDSRILAQARRAPAPRSARWWLPASLAASLLLAVLIAHWQLEDSRAPSLIGESDVLPERTGGEQRTAPSEPAPEPLRVQPPPAASPATAPEPARAPPEPAAPAAAKTAPQAIMSAPAMRTVEQSGVAADSAAESLTPEEWYTKIEALRAAGRIAESDAELARLEAAYPGWLARHHPRTPVTRD